MIPEKGPLEVVGAVERLHREGIRVTASLVGEEQSTAFQRVLLSRISAAGLGDIVEYSGPMHGRAKWQCLLRSDIFVFPSSYKYEAFPLVILEAMAASLPVVATDIGAVGDMVVDGETGFLVPQGDSEALADKLRMLCNDSDLRHRMGAAGRNGSRRSSRLSDSRPRWPRCSRRPSAHGGAWMHSNRQSGAVVTGMPASVVASESAVRPDPPKIRVAVFQRMVPEYRVPVLDRLGAVDDLELTIYSTRFAGPFAHATAVSVGELRVGRVRLHPRVLSQEVRQGYDVLVCEGGLSLVTSVALALGARASSCGLVDLTLEPKGRRPGREWPPRNADGSGTQALCRSCDVLKHR